MLRKELVLRNDFLQKFETPVRNLEEKLEEFGSTLKVSEKLQAKPEYFVTVVGKSSSGKSAVLNQLLFYGENSIPTNMLPETCLINEIRYGTSVKAKIVSDGTEREVDISQISEVSKEEKTDSIIKMESSDDLLSDQVVFVDTPGINSVNESHTDITFRYLPKSQFVLFVIDINNGGFSKSEIDFIKNRVFKVTQNNMFILLNKSDSMIASDCEQIREQVIQDLANTGIKPERVCLVSGLKGTGIAELKANLKCELDAKRTEYYKNYTQGLIANFVELAIAELKMKLVNMGKDASAFAADKAAMEAEIKTVSEKYRQLNEKLCCKIENLFRDYEGKIKNGLSDVAEQICSVVKKMPLKEISGDKLDREIQVALKKYIEDRLQPSFSNDFHELLEEMSTDLNGLFEGLNAGTNHDFCAPGKTFYWILSGLDVLLDFVPVPGDKLGKIVSMIVSFLLQKLLEKGAKSFFFCCQIRRAFDKEFIPKFVTGFNSRHKEIEDAVKRGTDNFMQSRIAVIESSYNTQNINALKAKSNAKNDIKAAIKEAEELKALLVS